MFNEIGFCLTRGNRHGESIDQIRDRSPQVLDDLVARRQVNHSTVAIQELMHTVDLLNPSDARTAGVIGEIGKQISAMPPHRVFAPDVARKLGLVVLTANVSDYDILLQFIPVGRALFYRQK